MELGLVIPGLEEYYQKGDFYKTIEALQKAEIRNIEAHASFLLGKTQQKLARLNQDLLDRNIIISSIHAPFGEDKDLSSQSFRIRKRAINQHIAVMKQMDIIKTQVLTIHPGSKPEKQADIPLSEKLFKKSLETLLKKGEKLQIKLAIENMLPMRPGEKIITIKEILDEFPSPFLGVCFDTGHANIGEGVFKTFNAIKENIFDFHIHDNDSTKDMHLQPPYGNIDWAEFFDLAETIKYQRPLMIEALPWQGRDLGWMFKEVKMLKDNKRLRKAFPRTLNQSDVTSDGSGQEHFLKCAKCNHFIYGSESAPVCYCSLSI